ncbi:MAG: RloB family protein [Candidatus Cloacimonadaceae bacterium]|jgi:hypothetical protein
MAKKRKTEQGARYKQYRPIIKVFCDGETEEYYIQSVGERFERDRVSFHIAPLLNQADQFKRVFREIRSLLKDKEHEQYKLIFYVLDMDTIYAQSKITEYTQARDNCLKSRNASGRVFIIETRPCFEFWLLLHFETISRQFNCCNDVIRELKKHWPNYTKTTKQVYDKLQDKLDTAIDRSRSIKPAHSYSQMHILFEQLNEKFPDCRLT